MLQSIVFIYVEFKKSMFETHESGKINIPFSLKEKDEYAWRYVYSFLHSYWFYVVKKPKYLVDGEQPSRIIFLSYLQDLKDLIATSDWILQEVQLVSPPSMNRTNNWKMEIIKEILEGRESREEYEQYGNIFVMENGYRYINSVNNIESELVNLEKIYVNNST